MKNKDVLQMEKTKILQKMNDAIQKNDPDAFAAAFEELAGNIQEAVIGEAQAMIGQQDATILSSRGVRQLTSEETKYYQAVIEAMKSSNPQQALTGLDVVLPKTTIDSIFEDMAESHELLQAINFQNTTALTEWLLNTNAKQLATWGALTDAITKELSSGFKKIDLSQNKLSAFMVVSNSMLDLGPAWLDVYLRAVLQEALYCGLENGIINGNGKGQPIGMIKDIHDGVSVNSSTGYPDKTATAITDLSVETYGTILGGLAKDENEKYRAISELLMVVNPEDYFTKIMPVTTVKTPLGTYVNNVFPFPTRVVQSTCVAANKAIMGIGQKYFMGIGTGKDGKIEYDDSVKFLEDQRAYRVKLYGDGRAADDNCFKLFDITNLKKEIPEVSINGTPSVTVEGTVKTKEQA